MGTDEDATKTVVKTTVPAYQKREWKAHADDLDMSQSEFVRTMVQAGRRGFDPGTEEPGSEDATPGVDGLETRVLDLLAEEPRSWDELVDGVVGDVEARLEATLRSLQAENRVQYRGPRDGYALAEDGNE